MRQSREVDQILSEANDIATQAGHPFSTGHVLLGMLTSQSRARQLLVDLKADAARVLEALHGIKRGGKRIQDSTALLERVEGHMYETARRTGAPLVSSLHLLLALTREKGSVAYKVFQAMGLQPMHVRTVALQRIHGPMPKPVDPRPSRAFEGEPSRSVAVADARPEPEPKPKPVKRKPKTARQAAEAPTAKAKTAAPEGKDTPGTTRRPPWEEPGADDDAQTVAPPSEAAERFALDEEAYPLLTSLGRNLTLEAAEGHLDPVVGRDALIEQMIDVLNKRRSNNPCLVGEPGVGKTAIVEGLARALLERSERVQALKDRVVVSIDVGALVAGTELRGAFSRRMQKLKEEVRKGQGHDGQPHIIVFIDEIHTLVGAGAGDGALDAANDLKTALARGEFPCIGATTPREYHRYIEKDPALERRFQPLEVPEPSEDDALAILEGVVPQYEAHHHVVFDPPALEAAVRMSRRYVVDRRLPDKAINVIDTAAARAVRRGKETVEVVDVAEVVSETAHIPLERLMMTDADRILRIRDALGSRVVGHDLVLDTVSDVIQRGSAGFGSKRPIGSFLFLGPTGVGKTETAKVLADFLFCSKDALTRFDMSEFMERHSVARLLGAAPGYVGHEEAGQLTASLARRPYQILLFDEIEKAHPDVLHLLLQMLDEGHLTDAKGHKLTLQHTVVILTSNLGAKALHAGKRRRGIGFGGDSGEDVRASEQDVEAALADARKAMPPELWGRIDEKCVFLPLGRAEIAKIAELLIAESSDHLARERGIAYRVTTSVVEHLIDSGGWEVAHGARPMRRAVQRVCESAIARAILKGEASSGDTLELSVGDDGSVRVGRYVPPTRPARPSAEIGLVLDGDGPDDEHDEDDEADPRH